MKKAKDLIGRVQKNARGFAFIIPLEPGPDTYVSPEEARRLLNRDLVLYSIIRDGKRYFAKILEIKERGISQIHGRYCSHPHPHVVTPAGEIFSAKPPGTVDGTWVIADIVRYPNTRVDTQVSITECLGSKLLPAHDNRITCALFGLPTHFSNEAIIESHQTPEDLLPRQNLEALPFVTIDGETAEDFDDAIFVKAQSGEDAFQLFVAIADVSHFVRPNTALDREARLRSTSVYFPGACIPMLPEALSNDQCSLKPHLSRKCVVTEITLDRDGQTKKANFYSATIQSKARLTYEEVQEHFDHHRGLAPELTEPLRDARMLFRKLRQLHMRRHALDFSLPEVLVRVDETGNPIRIERSLPLESHQLIEQFMVSANNAVASRLKLSSTLFRVHESPDVEKLETINDLLKAFGISGRIEKINQKELSKLLKVDNPALHRAILRTQKQARYDFQPGGHFGLALDDYLHFTSPIRRYPDLVVHRALKHLIGMRQTTDKEEQSAVYDLARETSDKERRAMDAERFIVRRKQCWYMLDQLGEEYGGIVNDLSESGVFVTLPNGIDGFCPLADGIYDPKRARVKSGGVYFSLGSSIRVVVSRVDVEMGRIELLTT